jgi:hypothetical protein
VDSWCPWTLSDSTPLTTTLDGRDAQLSGCLACRRNRKRGDKIYHDEQELILVSPFRHLIMDSQPGGVEILLCRCLHSSLCAMEKVGMNNEDQQSMEMEGRPLLWQPWMRCWSSRRGCTRGDGATIIKAGRGVR